MTHHIWKSTYKQSMGEYFSRALDEMDSYRFIALWGSFVDTYIIQSVYFKTLLVGDEKHALQVNKDNNGIITVIFIIK